VAKGKGRGTIDKKKLVRPSPSDYNRGNEATRVNSNKEKRKRNQKMKVTVGYKSNLRRKKESGRDWGR